MKRWIAGILAALFVPSCGGGGIGGTGIGSVSGFGSVFVNGIEWFLIGANVSVDGHPASEADLRLGMVIRVDGYFMPDGETGFATDVSFRPLLQGPVSAVTPTSATTEEVVIFGRTVVFEDGVTVFDDSDPAFGFGTAGANDLLEVSGLEDGSGVILATWVSRDGTLDPGMSEGELEGEVSGWDGSSFQIGAVTVYVDAGTDLSELPGGVVNGEVVEAKGILLSTSEILAERVRPPQDDVGDTEKLSLEGLVSDFVSLSDFRVAGQLVDASGATFEPANPSLVVDGARLEVEGPKVGGVLVAEKVHIE